MFSTINYNVQYTSRAAAGQAQQRQAMEEQKPRLSMNNEQ
jgi:hypothetical protein